MWNLDKLERSTVMLIVLGVLFAIVCTSAWMFVVIDSLLQVHLGKHKAKIELNSRTTYKRTLFGVGEQIYFKVTFPHWSGKFQVNPKVMPRNEYRLHIFPKVKHATQKRMRLVFGQDYILRNRNLVNGIYLELILYKIGEFTVELSMKSSNARSSVTVKVVGLEMNPQVSTLQIKKGSVILCLSSSSDSNMKVGNMLAICTFDKYMNPTNKFHLAKFSCHLQSCPSVQGKSPEFGAKFISLQTKHPDRDRFKCMVFLKLCLKSPGIYRAVVKYNDDLIGHGDFTIVATYYEELANIERDFMDKPFEAVISDSRMVDIGRILRSTLRFEKETGVIFIDRVVNGKRETSVSVPIKDIKIRLWRVGDKSEPCIFMLSRKNKACGEVEFSPAGFPHDGIIVRMTSHDARMFLVCIALLLQTSRTLSV